MLLSHQDLSLFACLIIKWIVQIVEVCIHAMPWHCLKGEHWCKLIFYRGVSVSKSSNFTTKLFYFLFSITPFKPSDFENRIFFVLLLVPACGLSLILLLPASGLTLLLLVPARDSLCSYLSLHVDSDWSYLWLLGLNHYHWQIVQLLFRLQHVFWFFP
jgi:hypothetical protein